MFIAYRQWMLLRNAWVPTYMYSSSSVYKSTTHNESLNVPVKAHIGQVWHHVSHHLEACVLSKLKRLAHSTHCVTSISIPGHILIHTLHTYLQSSTTVAQHLAERSSQIHVHTYYTFPHSVTKFANGNKNGRSSSLATDFEYVYTLEIPFMLLHAIHTHPHNYF